MKKLLLLIAVLMLFSCKNSSSDEISDSVVDSLAFEAVSPLEKLDLTPQEKYLFDNGFKIDADFTPSQFKEFKSAINTGLFKDESFCLVYNKALKLDGIELKQYLKKYKKIPYFETLLFFYGPKVCDVITTENSSYNSSLNSGSYTNSNEDVNPCIMSEDFIKKDLYNPSTADISMFDCSIERNADGTYTILRKVSAKNSFGVEKEYIYKVQLGYKGGIDVDINNWDLINIRAEEYK